MSGIPKGYKKTDVGEIPDDWKAKELKSIGIFSKGRGISRSEVKEQGKPCLRYGEIYTIYDTVIYALKSFISDESVSTSKRLYPGDIIFAASGETSSEIAKNVTYLGEEEAYVGGDTIILTPKSQDSVFLSYLLNSYPIAKQKSKIGQGDAVVHIHISKLDKIIICIPSLTEQQTIAQVLSDMDALIEAQKELIAKKRDIKQGTMQDLLSGRVRLPGYETKSWKHTDIGDIPDDWEVKKLGDISDLYQPKTISQNEMNESGSYLVYGANGVIGRYHQYNHKEPVLMITCRGNTCGTINISSPYSWITGNAMVVRVKNKEFIDNNFITYFLKYTSQISGSITGGAQPQITREPLKKLWIYCPGLSEQQAIAQVLSDMDNEIETLEAELEKLNHMKRGMMQELLTGRIRLI